jgi:hypothetical protein
MIKGYLLRIINEVEEMKVTFKAVIWGEGKTATGIPVPVEIVETLAGGKKPLVKASINGYTFRNSVMPYNGEYMLPLSAENREAAGVRAGDQVEVALELDTEPRIVEIPTDLQMALAKKSGAFELFESLSYSKRKEFVRQVENAKTQETRDKRIAGIADQLGGS